VTLGSTVQKFPLTGGVAVQTKDLGGPALALAGVGVPVPTAGAGLLSWLAVATQTTSSAFTTSVFSFEVGGPASVARRRWPWGAPKLRGA
jgi:hypothetical protein